MVSMMFSEFTSSSRFSNTATKSLGEGYVSSVNGYETPEFLGLTTEQTVSFNSKDIALDPGVTSTINLRYEGEIISIDDGLINIMIGNKDTPLEALNYLRSVGVEGVKDIITPLFNELGHDALLEQANVEGIKQEEFASYKYYANDYGPDITSVANEIYVNLLGRLAANTGNLDFISVKSKYHPGTNGKFTNKKYLELDHSVQVIYAWEDGELYRSWYASGFYDEYAVFGVFDLKNKSKNAWSPIAEKWMPYWMAFYYDGKQQAWFGLHELVYWYDDEGNYIEESSDSIGNKKSGGCVRLDRGEMKELYDWAEVGMYFLIHE